MIADKAQNALTATESILKHLIRHGVASAHDANNIKKSYVLTADATQFRLTVYLNGFYVTRTGKRPITRRDLTTVLNRAGVDVQWFKGIDETD